MSDFRFLHAADIHLDSPLQGLARYDGVPLEEVRGATRAAFDGLISLALTERVDFIVLAGDLFDGDWRDMGTGLYFARAMGRLAKASNLNFSISRTRRIAILSVGIAPPKRRSFSVEEALGPRRHMAGSNRNPWRDQSGMDGGIKSERVAASNRNGWRDQSGICT